MSRNYFDPNDKRNYCSLAQEAKKYSKDNANALRSHYEAVGAWKTLGIAALSFVCTCAYNIFTAEPKYDKIVK